MMSKRALASVRKYQPSSTFFSPGANTTRHQGLTIPRQHYSLNYFTNKQKDEATRKTSSFTNYSLNINANHYTNDAEKQRILKSVEQVVQSHQFAKQSSMSGKGVLSVVLLSLITSAGIYVTFRLRKGENAFVPLWLNRSTREVKEGEVNINELKNNAEYKLLEKLSMNGFINKCFGLPLALDNSEEFNLWAEYKYPMVSGLEFDSKTYKPSWTTKAFRFREICEDLMELVKLKKIKTPPPTNIHEVPLINSNGENLSAKTYDIFFLGVTRIQSTHHKFMNGHNYEEIGEDKNKQSYAGEGKIVFKGVVDFEHANQVKVIKADLIIEDKGQPVRITLW